MSIGKVISKTVVSLTDDCYEILLPPEEGIYAIAQPVISFSLVRNTRGYIERIVHQINGCYVNGMYDACAVMIRRFLEILIIESFEQHHMAEKIKNANGDFVYLSDLIVATINETSWNLSRNTKIALPKLKDIGDKSAHSRRFNAVRSDIDRIMPDLRIAAQELIYLADLIRRT
jgi:hypothetical protein